MKGEKEENKDRHPFISGKRKRPHHFGIKSPFPSGRDWTAVSRCPFKQWTAVSACLRLGRIGERSASILAHQNEKLRLKMYYEHKKERKMNVNLN